MASTNSTDPPPTNYTVPPPVSVNFTEDDYVAPSFSNTKPIVHIHNLPRGPFSNNITTGLVDVMDNTEEAKDYIFGICFVSIIILGVLVVWSLVLLIFKCLGPKWVGWLSGAPPRKPKPPPGYDKDEHEELGDVNSGVVSSARESDVDLGVFEDALEEHEDTSNKSNRLDSEGGVEIDHGVLPETTSDLPEKETEEETGSFQFSAASDLSDADKEGDSPSPPASELHEEASDPVVDKVPDEEEGDSPSPPASELHEEASDPVIDKVPADRVEAAVASQDETLETYRKQMKRYRWTMRISRSILLFSCFSIIIASALFVGKGVVGLNKALGEFLEGLEEANDVATAAIDVIDNYTAGQASITSYAGEFSNTTDTTEFCPNLEGEFEDFCQSLTAGSNVVCDASAIREGLEVAVKAMTTFANDTVTLVGQVRSDLEEILEITEEVDQQAKKFKWSVWVATAFAVILDIQVLWIMYGVVQAWREKLTCAYRCFEAAFLKPLLFFNLFMMWLFATIFAVGSIVTADFCYDSPTTNVNVILHNIKGRFTPFFFKLIDYWLVKGCEGGIPLEALKKVAQGGLGAYLLVDKLLSKLAEANVEELTAFCGQDASYVVSFAQFLDSTLSVYLNAIIDTGQLLTCSVWNPIYITFMYDGVCYDGVSGLRWVYSTCLTIAVFTMILATFRFALQPVKEAETEQNIPDEGENPVETSWYKRIWCHCCQKPKKTPPQSP